MTQIASACKNCNTLLTGNFCHACGQKADTHRITFKHLMHEFFHALTHADKGILFLVKELLYRPGYVTKEYLEGKRKKYFNPLSFLVIVSAVYALVVFKSGYFESMHAENVARGTRAAMDTASKWPMYMGASMRIIVNHGKIIHLVLIVPILTGLTWLMFWKPRYNFAETLVLGALYGGLINVIFMVIFIPAFLLFGEARINNYVYQIVCMVYLIIAHYQLFKNNIIFSMLRSIAIFLLFIVLFWVLIVGFVWLKDLTIGL
jgi:hypothetical protein